MRKEITFAIIAGITLGVALAYGIWKTNSTAHPIQKLADIKTSKAKPTSASPKEFSVTLLKPNEYDVISTDKVTVSGLTKQNIWVVISGENDDYIVKSSATGEFNADIELVTGINQITVSALDNKDIKDAAVTVVYSSEFSGTGEKSQ